MSHCIFEGKKLCLAVVIRSLHTKSNPIVVWSIDVALVDIVCPAVQRKIVNINCRGAGRDPCPETVKQAVPLRQRQSLQEWRPELLNVRIRLAKGGRRKAVGEGRVQFQV
jgi:hypothetical protein